MDLSYLLAVLLMDASPDRTPSWTSIHRLLSTSSPTLHLPRKPQMQRNFRLTTHLRTRLQNHISHRSMDSTSRVDPLIRYSRRRNRRTAPSLPSLPSLL